MDPSGRAGHEPHPRVNPVEPRVDPVQARSNESVSSSRVHCIHPLWLPSLVLFRPVLMLYLIEDRFSPSVVSSPRVRPSQTFKVQFLDPPTNLQPHVLWMAQLLCLSFRPYICSCTFTSSSSYRRFSRGSRNIGEQVFVSRPNQELGRGASSRVGNDNSPEWGAKDPSKHVSNLPADGRPSVEGLYSSE